MSDVNDGDRSEVPVAIATFEAAMLVRCTGVGGANRARAWGDARARVAVTGTGATHPTLTLAEFDRVEAARRLAQLLDGIGWPASLDVYSAGTRHRYDIHRITAPYGTAEALHWAWRTGYAALCDDHSTRTPGARRRRMAAYAAAAWRAALLVAGPVRAGCPGVRVPDLHTATALMRSARVLQVPVRMDTRPGRQLVLHLPDAGRARAPRPDRRAPSQTATRAR